MSKLLPCPFCGGEARFDNDHPIFENRMFIGCTECNAEVEPLDKLKYSKNDQITLWNTRPTPARCDELVTIGAAYLGKFFPRKNKAMWPDGAHEIVTRQNAEEVIAAKDARIKQAERNAYENGQELCRQRNRAETLEADNKRLREALEAMLIPFEDSNCRYDHHDYCQEHFLEEDCCVAKARAALGEGKL